ncbi:MAG: DUF4384 domain-containing protein [Spirochaetales bacterium]|nr:DUF4384 domain-containing protein [Leptospiraceae bacterium]MCP5482212.1 DUF4384 domain-containing protein [Spirochaetales bacterium]MCP5484676.1 DUF4384 domain-containing protein [Spirochaetales bacterium]
MRNVFLSILLFLVPSVALLASTPPIAVMPFKSQDQRLGEQVAAGLLVDLRATGHFTLVERGQLEQALNEIAQSQSGLVDSETVQEIGHMVGAEYMIVGDIEARGQEYLASARVLRTETGIVIAAARQVGSLSTVSDGVSAQLVEQLRIYLLMDNPDSPYSILLRLDRGADASYRLGDRLKLTFRVIKHRDEAPDIVYIQLYSIDAVGAMTLIYPNKFTPQMQVRVGQEYSIPAPEDDFEWKLVPPAGTESIQAIVTRNPIDLFGLRDSYRTRAFPLASRTSGLGIFQGIQTQLREEDLGDYSAERVSYILNQD